jgi:hypothetical protein
MPDEAPNSDPARLLEIAARADSEIGAPISASLHGSSVKMRLMECRKTGPFRA